MTGPTLEAVKLSKRYGAFFALSDLNLRIEGPKCVGFLGPNGAGKTTTLKIFTGLAFPTSGEALINGVDIRKDKKKALAATAALVETPEIYPELTPREALMMVAEQRGVPADIRESKIDESLREVKMEEWADKRVGKFSKGMKQRIAIASTMLNDPEIILLDEPTSGLDPRGMSEMRDIIRNLKRSRLVFMSSHLLPEVTDVCDEVAIIDHGKLLAYDSIQNLTAKFAEDRATIEIDFAGPIGEEVVEKVRGVRGISRLERVEAGRIRVKLSGGPQDQERVISDLASLKIGITAFRPSSSALEDVYLRMIKETL